MKPLASRQSRPKSRAPHGRSVLLLILVASLLGLAGVPVSAAVGTGSISGTVTDESGGPVRGVCVAYYNSAGNGLGFVGTGAGGEYSIGALAPDAYRLEFFTCHLARLNLVDEYYDNKLTLASATPITVVADTNTPNNNAVLETGGTLSGRVTNSLGEPVANAVVRAYDSRDLIVGEVGGGEDGHFAIDGLRSDEYRVQANDAGYDPNYVAEFYDNQGDLSSAKDITVVQGVETPNINLQLVRRGSISGTVTDSVGSPLDRVNVSLYNSSNELVTYLGNIVDAGTAADGTYTVNHLEPGTYRVRFGRNLFPPGDGLGPFAYQFYGQQSTLSSAQTVTVTAGTDTPGIDAALGSPGSISGTVTSGGSPRANVCITAFDASGVPLGLENLAGIDDRTDAAGHYSLTTLPAGSYRLLFLDCPVYQPVRTLRTLAAQYYSGATQLAQATPVVVTTGADRSGTDVAMVQSGSIAGTVTVPGSSLATLCVDVFDADGGSQRSIIDPEAVYTKPGGSYVIDGLRAGDYRLKFSDCARVYGAETEFYNDKPDLASANPVAVAAGVVTSGVDATLALDTSAPDTVIETGPSDVINVNQATFTFAGAPAADTARVRCRIDSEPFKRCVSPKTFSSLAMGEHTVSFQAEDWIPNKDQTPAARTFTVQPPTEPARTGSISGTVTIPGSPSAQTCVDVFDVGGNHSSIDPASRLTQADGTYLIVDLPAGDYRVKFSDCLNSYGAETEFYNDKPDLASANAVTVSAGSTRSGVDATLAVGTTAPDTVIQSGPVSVIESARIGKLRITGPAKVSLGQKATYTVRVKNTGAATAKGVKLKVRGKGVGAKKRVGRIARGATKKVKVTFKLRKPGRVKAAFKVTSENAGTKTVKRKIMVTRGAARTRDVHHTWGWERGEP